MNLFPHKYQAGDVVGVVADCMADCEVVYRLRKRPGKVLSYVVRAVMIHHPRPKESFFGKNKQFLIEERRVTVLLRKHVRA
jgi:hypothetical protein